MYWRELKRTYLSTIVHLSQKKVTNIHFPKLLTPEVKGSQSLNSEYMTKPMRPLKKMKKLTPRQRKKTDLKLEKIQVGHIFSMHLGVRS